MDKLFSLGRLGVGAGVTTGFTDTSAVLDVNGQIRIRGLGPFLPATGKMLTAVDGTGLAQWVSHTPLTNTLSPGFGINATALTATPRVVAIDPDQVQKRVTPLVGCPLFQGMSKVDIDGLPSCFPLVITLTTASPTSGLAMGGIGPLVLAVQTGSGLQVSGSNQVVVRPPTTDSGLATGSGLTLSGGALKFDNLNCGPVGIGSNTGEYWQYNTSTGWGCGTLRSSAPPGESIMYIKTWGGAPMACPGASSAYGAWTDLGYTQENATTDSTPLTNYIRYCYRNSVASSDRLCQVMYLKQRSMVSGVPTNPPACPASGSGWVPLTASANYDTQEYAGDSTSFNNVRTCYRCI